MTDYRRKQDYGDQRESGGYDDNQQYGTNNNRD
jgi:hypothetical protein